MNKQIEEMRSDLIEIFDEEYERRRLITPQNTAEKLSAKGYRKPEWISVTERLPKTYESVLVYMPGETPNPTVHEGFLNRFGRWYAGGFDRLPDEVVMWMYLPEPPKMKGGEEK